MTQIQNDSEMSYVGKHRGWLLVYELQYWIILAISVLGAIFLSENTIAGVASIFVLLAFWGALIWSLHGSTDVVRRVHIGYNWLGAAAMLFIAFSDPPEVENPAYRYGEYMGNALSIAFFIAWALYWHRSIRVQNSYPARHQEQEP